MEKQPWVCPGCSRMIAPEDTFVFSRGRLLSHLDGKRPQTLSPEERALFLRYCWQHTAIQELVALAQTTGSDAGS